MKKKLSFVHNEHTRVFFTSDPHLYHDKDFIYKKRGFNSAVEYKDGWLAHVNSTVTKDDVLFIIGDFSLNSTVEQVEKLLKEIKCRVYLCFGNHESSTYRIYKSHIEKIYQKDIEVYPLFWENVIFLGDYQEIDVSHYVKNETYRQTIVLCHYPIASWNLLKHNSWMICGHSHGSFEPSTVNGKSLGKILDVGWDTKMGIYSFDDIDIIMSYKETIPVDHHI